jgi:hypothetical protein
MSALRVREGRYTLLTYRIFQLQPVRANPLLCLCPNLSSHLARCKHNSTGADSPHRVQHPHSSPTLFNPLQPSPTLSARHSRHSPFIHGQLFHEELFFQNCSLIPQCLRHILQRVSRLILKCPRSLKCSKRGDETRAHNIYRAFKIIHSHTHTTACVLVIPSPSVYSDKETEKHIFAKHAFLLNRNAWLTRHPKSTRAW